MKPKTIKPYRPLIILFFLAAVLLPGGLSLVRAQDNDVIIQAMKDELDRAMKSLVIENMDKPYYLEYSLDDYWQWSIEGSFGSLTESKEDHRRILSVDLRVGDYRLDNTGFVDRSSMFSTVVGSYKTVVIDDDYNALRRSLWLATDEAYKSALKQLASKKAYLKSQVQTEEIPDFSKEEGVQKIAPFKILKPDRAKAEKMIKSLSAVFRKFPALHESHVKMQIQVLNKYFVNNEGTIFRRPETLVALEAAASTQATDGMKLKHFIPFYAWTLEDLPAEKELAAGIVKMADELTALASAPVLENYIGPVLFTQQAAAELFTQVLVPNLSGQRPPVSDMPQMEQISFSSKLVQMINRKVLPSEISITDDPTRTDFNKHPLLGSYLLDDEGVPARPVNLVERGILKTLLMSRRPRKEIQQSNGHGRVGIMGNPGVQVGNLLITADNGKTYPELKEILIQVCKDQGLEFGLIVKTMDNPAITGVEDSMSFFTRRMQSGPQLTQSVVMARIYVKDGREEPVRGISLGEFNVGDLKNIEAVGNDYYVMHRMMGSGGGVLGGFFSLYSTRGRQDIGIPTSIIAPSILFEELEFKKSEEKREKPPLLPHPFFGK